jgi:long-subunit acyl-CoA synthetase (AMP-forming)
VILYLDALFAERQRRAVAPSREIPGTLSKLYLQAMRAHDRPAALRSWAGDHWDDTPDWRLDRQVIRLGLFMRERAGLQPGDAVVLLAPLCREWLLADWAAAVQGAVSIALDLSLPDTLLADALAAAAPRIALVADTALAVRLGRLRDRVPGLGTVVALDSRHSSADAVPLDEVLDLGGTLDTPERANAFRAQARTVAADAPALRHASRDGQGRLRWVTLTQGAVTKHLQGLWVRHPAQRGDVAYVAAPEVTLRARLALYALVADGYTTVALGTAERAIEEITTLRPHVIVASPDVLARAANAPSAVVASGGGMRKWLPRLAALVPGGMWQRGRRAPRAWLGGRVRWVSSIADAGWGAGADGTGAVESTEAIEVGG